MYKNYLLPLLLLSVGFFSCDRNNEPDDPNQVPIEELKTLVDMNQTLGWKLFNKEQLEKPGENVLISPFSIQTALNMALNGAKGTTREEILELLDCPGCSVTDLNELHKALNDLLSSQSGHARLTVANGFFYDQSRVNVKTPFLDILEASYDSHSEQVNFSAQQTALDKINNWVKTNTHQKIDKILDEIKNEDVAFLINALHFKADWATGFATDMTSPGAFTKADGSSVTVDFIGADRKFSFVQGSNFNLVDIPLKDSVFSVSFIQPSEQNTNTNWHRDITPASWASMYDGIQYQRAVVFLPKLKMAYENDLIQSLKNLGVNAAFSGQDADFSDLGTASNNIYISQIKHKAVLEMDEKGVEGAAVTSIGFSETSAPPSFWFNRPYVLVLRHVPTNALVFMGFVADPSE